MCDYCPLKDGPYRVRLTIGGDKIPYYSDAGSPATSFLEEMFLFNSVVSIPRATFLSEDIKDYFLCSPISEYEYMKLAFNVIPDEIKFIINFMT